MRTKRVLVVEDEENYRELIIDRLTQRQEEGEFEWTSVESVQEAEKMIDERRFTALIVDLEIENSEYPGRLDPQGGIKVIKLAMKQNPLVKAIVLTVHKNDENLLAALRARAFDFFVKHQDDWDVLMSTLRRACRFYEQEDGLREIVAKYIHGHGCPIHPDEVCRKSDNILGVNSACRVFLAVPNRSEYAQTEQALKRVWEAAGIEPLTDMDTVVEGQKLCQICFSIRTSDFFMAEISRNDSPSVYHEIGMAQALGRKVGLVLGSSSSGDYAKSIPWNLQGFKPVKYDDKDENKKIFKLEIAVSEWILAHGDWKVIKRQALEEYKSKQEKALRRLNSEDNDEPRT